MSTLPPGVSVIKFRDKEKNGWYGLVLATKDDNAKVFRASPFDLQVVPRGSFTMMPDNPVPKAATLWVESQRGMTAPPIVRDLLAKLASIKIEKQESQNA
jgi:hypothetical protein